MLLVADIGNTSTTIGVYDNKTLVKSWKVASNKKRSEDEYGVVLNSLIKHAGLLDKINAAIISSVVLPLTQIFQTAIEEYLHIPVQILTHDTNHGLILDVEKPSKVGADRIANAYAAYKKYSATAAVVVDFGTATTFDIVVNDKENTPRFIGGIIAPGIGICADALSDYTSMLPNVKLEAPSVVIGRNTTDNMLSGLVRGHAAMIDGLMQDIEAELNMPILKIATGGYSSMITDILKTPFDYLDSNLTLEGLRLIYEISRKKVL